MKGSGIVFDNARRTATESFPPASLGGSFIAVFVGCDAEIEQGVFGKINAVEFAEDAKILQEVKIILYFLIMAMTQYWSFRSIKTMTL